jgi:hypothetical protein
MTDKINGHARLSLDPREKPRPCAQRLPSGGWCLLEDGHEDMCAGIASGPSCAPPPPERKYSAAHRALVERKWGVKTAAAWDAEVENRKPGGS